jgi:hypothetical protein
MRQTFMTIHQAFVTYSEGMNFVAEDAQPRDPGARRRR